MLGYSNASIVVRGPLGCGKSTVSKALAKILRAEYFSFDKVLEEKAGTKKIMLLSQDFIKANEAILPAAKRD